MIIHFIKNSGTGNWYAIEQNVAFFHSSLCEKIRAELSKVTGLIFYPSPAPGFIFFTFNDPADEAAFILQYSDGMSI